MAGLGRAEPEEAAIELLQVSGKVFGRHGRFVDLSQNVGAKAVLGHTGDKSGLLGRVADSGITPFIVEMAHRPVHGIDSLQRILQMGFDSILGFGVVRPAGPFDFDGIGDDIVARAASNPAKGQDSRIEGIDAAADDSLGRCQELGRSDDGVDTFMGHGGMAGLTIEDDADMIRSSHHRAGQDADLATGQGRPDVEAVNGIDAVEDAGRNHPLGAADRRFFFGWLADEDDRTGNIVFHLAQNLSGTEEDAHVAVMAAGVHLAGEIGRKGQARFFRHRQGVHIGPQGDDRSRLSL